MMGSLRKIGYLKVNSERLTMTSDTRNPIYPQGLKHHLVLWTFLAILLFFLLTEHRAHIFGALPYLLVAACPLMHLFMHGGHGHRRDARTHDEKEDEQ